MKVFISWSGEPSKQIALALRDWLPMVIQAVKPYMSDQDTHAGERWLQKVSTELDETNFSIICVTRENLRSPWLNFEAGALSKVIDTANVVPLLHGFSSASDLAPPLGQFQAKLANEKGIRELLTAIDSHTEHPLGPIALTKVFAKFWPDLEEQIDKTPRTETLAYDVPERADRELLEEILQLVRINLTLLDKDLNPSYESAADRRRQRRAFVDELENFFGDALGDYNPRSDILRIDMSNKRIPKGILEDIESKATSLGFQLIFDKDDRPRVG